ncbi:MAG: hypothetical protein WCA01_08640 [Burkholderiales bacterium]
MTSNLMEHSNAKRPPTQQPRSEEAEATEEARRAASVFRPAAARKSPLGRFRRLNSSLVIAAGFTAGMAATTESRTP